MTGLSRFDFYPRDWLSGTRELSDRARGAYIDLLCRMYDLGRALDNDERDLCRFLGYRDHRQLRPVLDELVSRGKLVIDDGKIFNPRAMREIDAALERIATGKLGGRPRKQSVEQSVDRDETDTREAPAKHQRATNSHSQGTLFVENQPVDENTPSPPPPPSIENHASHGAFAPLPIDPKKAVYDLGRSVLGARSGGQVTRLIAHHDGNLEATVQTLRLAETKSDANEYVGAVLRGASKSGASADQTRGIMAAVRAAGSAGRAS